MVESDAPDPARTAAIADLMRAFEQGGGYLHLRDVIHELAALEASDALCAIVEDQSITPSLRNDVLQALAAFPNEATIALFLDELRASSRKRKQIAIEALGHWRVHRAIEPLCEQFKRHKQTALRGWLIEALGRIAAPETIFVLQRWLREAPEGLLREDLQRLAAIPRVELLELLRTCSDESNGDVSEDSSEHAADHASLRGGLFNEAIEALQETLRTHQRAQLSPHRTQLEEALFE